MNSALRLVSIALLLAAWLAGSQMIGALAGPWPPRRRVLINASGPDIRFRK
jgi:hypothetical protein